MTIPFKNEIDMESHKIINLATPDSDNDAARKVDLYTHPTGDGNLHVPSNSTTNDGKVLTAGTDAGTYTWEVSGTVTAASLGDIIAAATGKSAPLDADLLALSDSAASDDVKKITWAQLVEAVRKRRVSSTTSAATSTPNADTQDRIIFTALAVPLQLNSPTGTPAEGDQLIFKIKDDGTARALDWTTGGSDYDSTFATLPTTTTVSKWLIVALEYNSSATKWQCMSILTET